MASAKKRRRARAKPTKDHKVAVRLHDEWFFHDIAVAQSACPACRARELGGRTAYVEIREVAPRRRKP